jgi:hypothetical protein
VKLGDLPQSEEETLGTQFFPTTRTMHKRGSDCVVSMAKNCRESDMEGVGGLFGLHLTDFVTYWPVAGHEQQYWINLILNECI